MKKFKKAIKKTAKNNATTPRKVKTEIESAITAAIKSPDKTPQAESFWKELTKNKRRPSPEEVFAAIIQKIKEKNSS